VVKSMPRASLSRPSTRDNARSMKTHLCDKNSQVQLVINCTPKQPMSFAIQNQAVEWQYPEIPADLIFEGRKHIICLPPWGGTFFRLWCIHLHLACTLYWSGWSSCLHGGLKEFLHDCHKEALNSLLVRDGSDCPNCGLQ
jgi:hypothetical protein